MDLRPIRAVIVSVPLMFALSACGGSEQDASDQPVDAQPRTDTIRGTLTYSDQLLLAPETMVTVQLIDDAAAGSPEAVVAETVFHHPGKPPVPFTLSYDPRKIETGRNYSLRAQVDEQRRLMFVSDTTYPVLRGEKQPAVEIVLKRVPGGRMERMAENIRANNPELVGHYSYKDGEGQFVDCSDGSHHPLAREEAIYALESEYRDVAPTYGDEVFVRVAGKYITGPALSGQGKEDFLVVLQVEEMSANTGCP